MSVAQTAQLIVEIIGKDLLTPAVASAESGLTSMSGMSLTAAKSASTAEKALGLVGSAATGMGNALNHAKGFLGGLISGPLGLLGLGAGALTAAGVIKETIGTANDLAAAIEKLAPLTGDSAEQLSGLLAVFNKFGVDTDTAVTRLTFMEKAVGNLTLTTASATKFQKEFGVSLVDASGKVKDANTILALAADYWTGTASAAQKAAFEAKLFGRGFSDMIPILNLGSKGLLDAESAAAALGLTLNAQNVGDLQKYQAQMRETGDVIGGLKLQIALGLIPTITDLAKSVSSFISDHRTDITSFFKNAVTFAKQVGGALISVGQGLAGLWGKIPGPMQTLLLQALVGNKVIKTVFGIDIVGSIAGAAATMGKNLLGSLLGSIFGKSIATPVVNVDGAVVNVGGVPGVGGAVAGAGGSAGGGILEAVGLGSVGAIAGTAAAIAVPLAGAWVLANMVPAGAFDKGGAAAFSGGAATGGGRTMNHPGVGAYNASNNFMGPAVVAPVVATVNKTTSAISSSQQAAMNMMNHLIAVAKNIQQEQAHGAAIKAIEATGQTMHQFLLAFRTGSAKVVIADFPKELGYLSTATDAQKRTAVYASGLRQDITALQKAEVGATADQKKRLDADILALQGLVKDTTSAVKGIKLTVNQISAIKEVTASQTKVTVKTSTTTAAKSTATAKNVGAKKAVAV